MKKTSLITAILLSTLCSYAQQLQNASLLQDSLHKSYKNHKTAGLVLLPVGGAAFVGGAIVILGASLNETGDNIGDGLGQIFGEEPAPKKDYSGQYTTGAVMMIGGAILAIVGATQLSAAHKVRKKMMNANLSFSPSYVPSLSTAGQTSRVPQTTVSLRIPIGK